LSMLLTGPVVIDRHAGDVRQLAPIQIRRWDVGDSDHARSQTSPRRTSASTVHPLPQKRAPQLILMLVRADEQVVRKRPIETQLIVDALALAEVDADSSEVLQPQV